MRVSEKVVEWALRRSRLKREDLEFPLNNMTLKQMEQFARLTHVPFGWLFLSDPPEENLPLEDFRSHPAPPSGELLDAVYFCQTEFDSRGCRLVRIARRTDDWIPIINKSLESGIDVTILAAREIDGRRFDPREWGGFALLDPPVILINGNFHSSKQIQILANCLAHIAFGENALVGPEPEPGVEGLIPAVERLNWPTLTELVHSQILRLAPV